MMKLGMQAKTGGTLVGFASATLMILYKRIAVILMHTEGSIKLQLPQIHPDRNWLKGSLVLLVSYFALSTVYISQTVTVEMYPAPIALTVFACLSGNLLMGIMAAILDHKASSWRLSWNITLLTPVYSGVVILGLVVYVQTVLVRTRGPVFMTAFRPPSTIVAAVL